jgi:hypothetical protein
LNPAGLKPIILTTDRRRDSFDCAVGKYGRSPITDYSYQSAVFGEFSGRFVHNSARSFWNISSNYLKHKARLGLHIEAMLFAFISVTAALPLINNVHALIEFMRAICSH